MIYHDEHMFDVVDEALPKLKTWVAGFDFRSVPKSQAVGLYERLVELERVVSAAKNLAADHMAESGAWWQTPYRSPAHYMAATESKTVNDAASILGAVGSLPELPSVEQAYRQGSFNELQAQQVVATALCDKDKQQYLIDLAEAEALSEFLRQCARVRSAALDEQGRQKNAHRRRFLHHWIDLDGAFRLSGRFTTEAGAEVLAALEPFRQQVTDRSSRRGRRGKISHGAALADSLVELCRGHNASQGDPLRPSPRVAVMVRVDAGALERGFTLPGETCEVPGVGPVTVETVRRWMASGNARVDAAVQTGKGIYEICRVDRQGRLVRPQTGLHEFYAKGRVDIPDRLYKALVERDPVCVVPGCGEMHDLEVDHVLAVEDGGPTTFYNLCRICAWHHVMKTHYGWVLKRRLGHWLWFAGGPPPRLRGAAARAGAAVTTEARVAGRPAAWRWARLPPWVRPFGGQAAVFRLRGGAMPCGPG